MKPTANGSRPSGACRASRPRHPRPADRRGPSRAASSRACRVAVLCPLTSDVRLRDMTHSFVGRTATALGSLLMPTLALTRVPVTKAACSVGTLPTAASVAAVPLTVTLGGHRFGLSVEAWRNFMPGSTPDGSPLLVALTLNSLDSTAFPASVTVDSAWVIMGDHVWRSVAVEENPRQPAAPEVYAMLRHGPTWDPGATIDIVVRLRDRTGTAVCLRAREQQIGRAD
jgi:hypothetical protein